MTPEELRLLRLLSQGVEFLMAEYSKKIPDGNQPWLDSLRDATKVVENQQRLERPERPFEKERE
jgi:hypothetical protein